MIKTLTSYVTIPAHRVKEVKAAGYTEFLAYTKTLLAAKLAMSLVELSEIQTLETPEGLSVYIELDIDTAEFEKPTVSH